MLTTEIAELEERKQSSKKKAAELSQKIRELETAIENANEAAIESQIESCQSRIRGLQEKCDNFRHQKDDYISKRNISEDKIRIENEKLKKLQSADSKRMNLLRNCNEDAFKGVQWLRMNKDSQNFENPEGIYEPIMTVVRQVRMLIFSSVIFIIFSPVCTNREGVRNLILVYPTLIHKFFGTFFCEIHTVNILKYWCILGYTGYTSNAPHVHLQLQDSR